MWYALTVAGCLLAIIVILHQFMQLMQHVINQTFESAIEYVRASGEQAKEAIQGVTGVYAPTPSPVVPGTFTETEQPRMATVGDFDDTDPFDEFFPTLRTDGAVIDGAEPFGVPGLVVPNASR
jgi:hypothetical protein